VADWFRVRVFNVPAIYGHIQPSVQFPATETRQAIQERFRHEQPTLFALRNLLVGNFCMPEQLRLLLPYIELLLSNQLEIRVADKSYVHGLGVFATQKIPANAVLREVTGHHSRLTDWLYSNWSSRSSPSRYVNYQEDTLTGSAIHLRLARPSRRKNRRMSVRGVRRNARRSSSCQLKARSARENQL
jgi:hypothetical protein